MANLQCQNIMSSTISGLEEMCLNNMAVDHLTAVPKVAVDNFIEGYEHPVSWFKKYNVQRDEIYGDILFDFKNITLEENNLDKPEHIKWKLFGYNLIVCYEYTSKGEIKKALEVIGDIEHILTSIRSDDSFLNSIQIALNHITFSFKGHLLKLCSLETSVLLESFVMPKEMDQVNKAALYGAQSLFFYEYGSLCVQLAKDSALTAISLNKCEAEWYYLLAKVFVHRQQTYSNFNQITKDEIDAAEKAVELGKNDKYKLHLAHVYKRMSKYFDVSRNDVKRKHFADAGLKLVKEVLMNSSNDLLVLKNCLLHLSKLSCEEATDETNEMLQNLVDKLKSCDYAYVQAAIGHYYLYNKMDYAKANFYLKKAFEVKSFGNSLDYVYTFYKIDPYTTQVESLLIEMMKSFPHPFNLVEILCQIISYLIVIKNDLIGALKYIPQLLSFKHVICVRKLQNHRIKFVSSKKPIYFISMLTEELNAALTDYTLPASFTKRISEVLQMFESYKQFVSCLMQGNKQIVGNTIFKESFPAKNNKPFSGNYNNKESWGYKNPKQDSISVKNKNERNWRSLKPEDSMTNPDILFRHHHRQISNNGLEIKFRLNSQK